MPSNPFARGAPPSGVPNAFARLSPYQPTLRDRAAAGLLGILGNGPTAQHFAEGLLGSTGLGQTRAGLLDFTPVGAALAADQSGRQMAHGHPVAGATGLLAAAIPIPGARGVKPLSRIVGEAEARGVKLSVQDGRNLVVSKLVVPKAARGQGIGSSIMQDLATYADANGKTMALTPSGEFGGSVPRLKNFYARLGFVPNRGRAVDYSISEAMYRAPRTQP